MIKNIIAIIIFVIAIPFAGRSQAFIDATDDAAVMPVKLLSFGAVLKQDGVHVTWSTASELNNASFNILRSVNGVGFNKVGTVAGNGTQSNLSNYNFIDKAFLQQDAYYQLEQIDVDGKKTLSAMVLVKFGKDGGITIITYPNPAVSHNFTLQLNNAQQDAYTIVIRNITGTAVYTQVYTLAGATVVNVQLPSHLQAGVYLLSVANKSASVKLNKQLILQ